MSGEVEVHFEGYGADGLPDLVIVNGRAFVHGDKLDRICSAARSSALEEAAKIAETLPSLNLGGYETSIGMTFERSKATIAAAIRERAKG